VKFERMSRLCRVIAKDVDEIIAPTQREHQVLDFDPLD
jgi:hypothetical protein